MFDKIVTDLVEEFDLDSSADRILVERAAMYLIRILRAEGYEAAVGLSEKSPDWGAHIAKLDSVLRGLFKDLAISRAKRMELEKGDSLLVSLDDVIRKFARVEKSAKSGKKGIKARRVGDLPVRAQLWLMWEKDYPKLRSTLKRKGQVGEEETES
jgi:hypothetical protein